MTDERCLTCGQGCGHADLVDRPNADTLEKLSSMRNELLQDDWAYWHDDPAIAWLNEVLGPGHPPFAPEGVDDCQTCDAPASAARPERAGELTPPTCPGPCPTCGAAPYFERHPTPYVPQPGDFVVTREAMYRKGRW